MVTAQLEERGITDDRILRASRRIDRRDFVPFEAEAAAYDDRPLSIGCGQTISQPYIVAYMTEQLCVERGHKVLEIGTGSGYQTAMLASLGARIYTMERIPELQTAARLRLDRLGYAGASYRAGDGTEGWPEEAPFDRIIVTACAPTVPAPLVDQLGVGGRLIIPSGLSEPQDLILVERGPSGTKQSRLCGVMFVKLVGRYGWGTPS